MTSANDIFVFIKDWKTRDEIRVKFNMSNTETYNFLKWAVNGKYIERCSANINPNKTNRTWLYKTKI